MTLKELRVIKKLTGMGQKAFAEAGDEGDPEALAALIYVLHKRDKISIPFDDVDLDFTKFTMEATEQELKELAAVEEDADEDPKVENVNGL
jgi:Tfp pilus assembly PilM family ATPase